MRILFIVPYVPNLIRVRPYNIIKSLTEIGHEVTVATLVVNDADQASADELANFCHQVITVNMPTWKSLLNSLKALFTSDPLQSFYSWNLQLFDQIPDANAFDVIHVEHLRGSKFALYAKENFSVPVVWDSVDCISHLFEQAQEQSKSFFGTLITKLDLERTKKYEGWLVSQFDRVLVTSEVDKSALTNLAPKPIQSKQIYVLPNGVNLEYFKPDFSVKRDPETLVVTGKMSYHANVTMVLNLVQNIMPIIWDKNPNVKVYVVGKDPSAEIQELGKNPNVIITGTVDDMRPYLHRSTVAVAPVVYGAGIQNKVLEAMACGTPVITTTQSAQAIMAEPGEEFCVADSSEEFAFKTLELINNPEYAERIGLAGYEFMKQNHDWTMISSRLKEVYDGIINGQRQFS